MLEDQREQLRIHAEAVKRSEQRGKLKAPIASFDNAAGSSHVDAAAGPSSGVLSLKSANSRVSNANFTSAAAAAAAASSPSTSSAALAPTSSSALISRSPAVSSTDTSLQPPAHSWTHLPEFQSLESLRSPGRKKYGTIMKAALRFLHSLRPQSINRSRGSHTVFHFQSGRSVTLVRPHAGSSKDGTKGVGYCTQLYAAMHEAAMQQFAPPAAALPDATTSQTLQLLAAGNSRSDS